MRPLFATLSFALAILAHGQPLDEYTGRYSYAFVEDGAELLPLQGRYTVEYLARGQWWSYMPPRTPVNYAGRVMELKSLLAFGRTRLLAVEPGKDWSTTDQKLRVVRGADTLIVDLLGSHNLEDRMRERTRAMELPPRPPVLIPFRKGWYDLATFIEDTVNSALTKQLDERWRAERATVLALYDTARYTFPLLATGKFVEPVDIPLDRDPNYRTQLLQFPAAGAGVIYELQRQNAEGALEATIALRVEMDPDGKNGRWANITGMLQGRYTVRAISRAGISTFQLVLQGPARTDP